MKIGIFSGSFDPIHIGHLALANYIVEFTEIEEIWFLISPHNPLKLEKNLSDETIRYEIAKLALRNFPKLKASDFEFSLPKPSYTINTLEALNECYTEHVFSLIIGADNWNVFDSWKEPRKILENYGLKVYPRLGHDILTPPKVGDNIQILNSPIFDISSTFIRNSIAAGKDIRAFLPCEVYDYILKNKLYK